MVNIKNWINVEKFDIIMIFLIVSSILSFIIAVIFSRAYFEWLGYIFLGLLLGYIFKLTKKVILIITLVFFLFQTISSLSDPLIKPYMDSRLEVNTVGKLGLSFLLNYLSAFSGLVGLLIMKKIKNRNNNF